MSEFHEFYESVSGVGADVLWTVWCSNEPVLLDELVEASDVNDEILYRDVMYFVNCSLLYPVRVDNSIGVVYNPAFEWVSGVGELVRKHSKEELEFILRESEAGVEMYEDLHNADSVDEYVDKSADVSDVAEWVIEDVKIEWVADAIEYYDLFERLFEGIGGVDVIEESEMEKELVSRWVDS